MSEPRKIPTTCQGCGGEAYAFICEMKYSGPVTPDHPDGKYVREAELGGDLCDACSDKREVAEQVEKWRATHARNLEGSNLPRELHEIGFDGFPQREAVDLAKRWGNGEIKGLCFTGDTGVGKTWLAAAAMWPMLYRRRVRWVDTAQLMSALAASFGDEHRGLALRVVSGDGPAVLDDIDKVNPTESARQCLFAAINARIAAGAPLLITTNEPISGLGELLGKPIMSRLAGYCEVVEMIGPDRRVSTVPAVKTELRAA